MSLGLLLLAHELTALERAWMAEKGAAAELIAIKANMSFRIVGVEDENNDLRREVEKLRARINALQEEKAMMQTNLNAMNLDLLAQPEEAQQAAAHAASEASIEAARPPPPPPPPPPEKKSAADIVKDKKAEMQQKMKNFKAPNISFPKKKQAESS